MFIVKAHKSCLVTYLGLVFGGLAAATAFTKIAFAETGMIRFSLAFLVLAGVCDMFDGKVARMCKRTKEEKEFGIQLDSLADTFNFLAVPVIIMLSLGMNSWIDAIADIMLIICGVARLAFFNVHADMDNPVKYYSGLPVTTTAITYPLFGLLHGVVSEPTFVTIYLILTIVTAFLFVLKIKVPKLKGVFYYIVPILAAILIALLIIFR